MATVHDKRLLTDSIATTHSCSYWVSNAVASISVLLVL